MSSNRSLVAATLCALALPLAACGGGSDSPGDDDDGPATPTGTHYGYVVSEPNVPSNTATARQFGLDLGGAKSDDLDGTVDNVLGERFGTLSALGFDVQATLSTAIKKGTIMLLVDFQTDSFTTSDGAGFAVKLGATSTPAACADAADMTCGLHLKGDASFTLSASSPSNAAVTGKITGGTFTGGPGDLSLQIALGEGAPIQINLKHARAKATGISEAGMTAIIGGAITVSDVNTQLIPAIGGVITGLLEEDCGPAAGRGDPAAGCNCKSSSTGTLLAAADISPKDCVITNEEIATNPLISTLLAPDICSKDTCSEPDALSFGVQVKTVKATITP